MYFTESSEPRMILCNVKNYLEGFLRVPRLENKKIRHPEMLLFYRKKSQLFN